MLPYATHSTQFPPFPRLWKEKQIRAMPEAARDPEMLFSKGRWRSGMYRQSSGTRLGTRWIHKLSIRQLGVSGYTTLSKVATCCDAKSHCKGSNRTFHLGKGSHLGVPKILWLADFWPFCICVTSVLSGGQSSPQTWGKTPAIAKSCNVAWVACKKTQSKECSYIPDRM